MTRLEQLGLGRCGRWEDLLATPDGDWADLLAAEEAESGDWQALVRLARETASVMPAQGELP